MSTAAVQYEASQSALPVCLLENPNRLVSLRDMLRFYAHRFVAAFNTFGQAEFEIRAGRTIPSESTMNSVGSNIRILQRECEQLGLEFSAVHLKRASKPNAAALRNLQSLLKFLEEAKQRIWDELDSRLYVQIKSDRAKYYEPELPPFGQKVFDQFPSAIYDVLEAGNCLSLERYTAAVFHLMRVMEAALKVLAQDLGIPYAPSWESYLRQLNTLVEGDWKSKSPDTKRKQGFYKELIGDIQAIKTAWRNPTMHLLNNYGDKEAVKIYECVAQFMAALAEQIFLKLHLRKPCRIIA